MHLTVFGLTISSSWGNGHATLWRALARAMASRGHTVVFFERNLPYYATTRDAWLPPEGVRIRFYDSISEIQDEALTELDASGLALFTSYCPDGADIAELILHSHSAIKAFYDLDTPVTLESMRLGRPVPYLPSGGLGSFDLVLSYTGGRALHDLKSLLGARFVAPLYGFVDPEAHFPVPPVDEFRGDLSYMGTYSADRQQAFETLFLEPARRLPERKFQIAGAQYPSDFSWSENINFLPHLAPARHSAFFCSSRATLNVTRRTMAGYGYCPSGRLFEAAACGAPILTDGWEGLDIFFAPGKEILRVDTSDDVIRALSMPDSELSEIAQAAHKRALSDHTAERRVIELETLCEFLAADVQAA
jgi:spore maturation protein CgeB